MRALGVLLFTTEASPACRTRQQQANGQRRESVSRPRTTEGNDCDLSTLEAGKSPARASSVRKPEAHLEIPRSGSSTTEQEQVKPLALEVACLSEKQSNEGTNHHRSHVHLRQWRRQDRWNPQAKDRALAITPAGRPERHERHMGPARRKEARASKRIVM